jgi:hypothetical protein
LLLVRSVSKGETMEKSTEKYHDTLMNTCARVAGRISSHFRVVVLEEGEDLVAGGSELPLRHVPEVGHLYDGVDARGPERERAHAALHHLDAPPEEARQAVAVAEGALVHAPVLEHAVRVVAHGVPVPVPPVRVRHHALQLLEAQVLVHHRVGAELDAPRGATEQHRVRVARAEVPRAEELQEHHVGALVVGQGRGGGGVRRAGRRGVGIQRDAPDGDGVRVEAEAEAPSQAISDLARRGIWALVQGSLEVGLTHGEEELVRSICGDESAPGVLATGGSNLDWDSGMGGGAVARVLSEMTETATAETAARR